jgi:phosphoribosylformylglycinamidine synthase I
MAKVKILVLRAPGTNCDRETAHAFELAGAEATLVHVNRFIRGENRLLDYQALVIPGGFTYGDDIAAGKVLANELILKLGTDLREFVAQGKLVMGICNGFQVLVKTGILPGPMGPELPAVTLTTNDSDRFECRWVHLAVNPETNCVFTRGIQRMYLPVAHAEGKLVAAPEIASRLRAVVTYTDPGGNPNPGYPANPNGSVGDIAGITDETGCVFALMPHPERYVRRTQHPRWTRGEGSDPGDGLGIFTNAVSWIEKL